MTANVCNILNGSNRYPIWKAVHTVMTYSWHLNITCPFMPVIVHYKRNSLTIFLILGFSL